MTFTYALMPYAIKFCNSHALMRATSELRGSTEPLKATGSQRTSTQDISYLGTWPLAQGALKALTSQEKRSDVKGSVGGG